MHTSFITGFISNKQYIGKFPRFSVTFHDHKNEKLNSILKNLININGSHNYRITSSKVYEFPHISCLPTYVIQEYRTKLQIIKKGLYRLREKHIYF